MVKKSGQNLKCFSRLRLVAVMILSVFTFATMDHITGAIVSIEHRTIRAYEALQLVYAIARTGDAQVTVELSPALGHGDRDVVMLFPSTAEALNHIHGRGDDAVRREVPVPHQHIDQ